MAFYRADEYSAREISRMKVSGFTFVRNAVKFDYPVVEAITSILPICDEFIVSIGNSDDETEKLIKAIDSDKIKIHHTVWNDELREGGRVLAAETDKAFAKVSTESDWAFYVQADEIVHEKYLDSIVAAMKKYRHNQQVEGLLFKYKHFYGSYDYIGDSRRWYRREIRVIRNDKQINSHGDAQGFRRNGEKLKVKLIDAFIYHYGWVKHPKYQQAKQRTFNKYWHDDQWVDDHFPDVSEFDYSHIDALTKFTESHPKVIRPRVGAMNWKFSYDPTAMPVPLRHRISNFIEKYTGLRLGEYRNYKLI